MSDRAKVTATVLTLLAALLLTPPAALAWGDNGHRVVGRLAEARLSDEARQELRQLAGAETLAMLATWPDFIRSNPGWRFAARWHWITVEDDRTLEQVMAQATRTLEPDNLVEAIDYFQGILAGDGERRRHFEELMSANGVEPRDGSVELTALSFLVHFIGDLHQPLHVGRGDDRGGNSIAVNFFGEVKKLHAVWDSGILERQGLSYTELSDFLEAEFAGQVDPGDGGVADWALESFDYRSRLYRIWDDTSRDNYLPELGFRYVYEHIGAIKRRLFLSGTRLAGLLNETWE